MDISDAKGDIKPKIKRSKIKNGVSDGFLCQLRFLDIGIGNNKKSTAVGNILASFVMFFWRQEHWFSLIFYDFYAYFYLKFSDFQQKI